MDWRRFLATGMLLSVFGWSSSAVAVDFKPFTDVENVCPDCNKGNTDVVQLSEGKSFNCQIVAENDDFLVAVRFGEVRAVPHSQVESVEWAGGERPADLRNQDQIVLKNGHVLTGEIVDDKSDPPLFQLESSINGYSYVAFKKQVQSLYRNGKRKEVKIEDKSSGSGASSGGAGKSSAGKKKQKKTNKKNEKKKNGDKKNKGASSDQ